jgi:hypothetical protein
MALEEFMRWFQEAPAPRPGFTKATASIVEEKCLYVAL